MLIPLTEIVNSVTTENPWWSSGKIPARFSTLQRRAYFEPFQRLAMASEINRAIILLGPRRVGKTVMTQQLVAALIDADVPPSRIMYVSIDTPTYTGQSLQFFVALHAETQKIEAGEPRYIIFDEIQYLADWERHLKVLVDRNPHIRFIASGSAAAALKLASAESGAGRFTEFMLPPLTFAEYLDFIGKSALLTLPPEMSRGFATTDHIDELNAEFVNYINYGGYPEAVVSDLVRMDAARFIKNDIIDKVLLRDLPQLYGINNIQELNNLFTMLAYQTGQEISLETLAQHSGISKPTINRYIEYLEAAFLVFRIRRVDDNAKTFTSRERTFKVYLTNPSMRAALFSPMKADDDAFGLLVETAILSQWFHSSDMSMLHYARWRRSGRAKVELGDTGEIDIVGLAPSMKPMWVIEVKWSDIAVGKSECWHSIREFVKGKASVKSGVFTTKTITGERRIGEALIRIVPASVYCFTVGRNTARSRGMELVSGATADSKDGDEGELEDADFDDEELDDEA